MSTFRVITRISPVNASTNEFSKLMKPTAFGNPIEVQKCNIVDPRNGNEFTMETFFCMCNVDFSDKDIHREIASECEKVPGLISAKNIEDLTSNLTIRFKSSEQFAFSVPNVLSKEKVKTMLNASKTNKSGGVFDAMLNASKTNKSGDFDSMLNASKTNKSGDVVDSKEKLNSGIKIHIDLKNLRASSKPLKPIKETAKNSPKLLKASKHEAHLVKSLLKYYVENECLICGDIKFNRSKQMIKKHMKTHIKRNSYVCHCCDFSFSSTSSFYLHVLKKEETSQYQCDVCNGKYKRKYLLAAHYHNIHFQQISTYTNKKSFLLKHRIPTCFSCSMCSKIFTVWKFIAQHKSVHSGKESYLCLFCGKSFANICLIRYHSHLRIIKSHTCKICHKTFSSIPKLLEHKRCAHFKQSLYLCDICGKRFNFQSNLKKHMQCFHSNV